MNRERKGENLEWKLWVRRGDWRQGKPMRLRCEREGESSIVVAATLQEPKGYDELRWLYRKIQNWLKRKKEKKKRKEANLEEEEGRGEDTGVWRSMKLGEMEGDEAVEFLLILRMLRRNVDLPPPIDAAISLFCSCSLASPETSVKPSLKSFWGVSPITGLDGPTKPPYAFNDLLI